MRRALATILPAALLLLALLVAPGPASAAERTVSVTARATLEVPNDSAGLGFSVSAERRSRTAALRTVASHLRRVIATVQQTPGVGPGDITTGRIDVRKSFRGERPVYRASEGIHVVLHEPDRAGELVGAAIAAGASGVSGPRFFVGDTEAAYSRALAAAFDKARAKAVTLATQAGAVLGPALSIVEGGAPELVPNEKFGAPNAADCVSTSAGSAAPRCTGAPPPPTKPGNSTVTATVGVVFALQ